MRISKLKSLLPSSPAFVLDEERIIANLSSLEALRGASGCKILYAVKALPLVGLLDFLKDRLDGFSVSSLFEAKLAKEVLGQGGSLHLTTPGLRQDEFPELADLCSHISFNSWSQQQLMHGLGEQYSSGLRINPKLSLVGDARYDPCRLHSKLGVAIDLLAAGLPEGTEGLHLHTNFAGQDIEALLDTITLTIPLLKQNPTLKWLNLGGGYLFPRIAEQRGLIKVINRLQAEFEIEIYLEPGKALVGDAGYLLCTVLDRFISDNKTVLILDTSVNHHPEIFEYQRKPLLLEEQAGAGQLAILAGSSCLAGDIFGEYEFQRLPEVGERLIFADVGAYSLIKANRFNGYNLPDIYRITRHGWELCRHYDYQDYRGQWFS